MASQGADYKGILNRLQIGLGRRGGGLFFLWKSIFYDRGLDAVCTMTSGTHSDGQQCSGSA